MPNIVSVVQWETERESINFAFGIGGVCVCVCQTNTIKIHKRQCKVYCIRQRRHTYNTYIQIHTFPWHVSVMSMLAFKSVPTWYILHHIVGGISTYTCRFPLRIRSR